MMAASGGRSSPCGVPEAKVRAAQAGKFLEVAKLVLDVDDDLATPGVSAALAVLAGIAASDALCCLSLGRRPRGQDHREAAVLLKQVEPEGQSLARTLLRLLDIKDGSQYGTIYMSSTRAATAVKNATSLVEAAKAAALHP